jgi:hypothetical protein
VETRKSMSNGDLNWIANFIWGKLDVRALATSLPDITELEPIDEPADSEDLDEAVDDPESEEVAA